MLSLDEIRRRNLERARELRKEIVDVRKHATIREILGGHIDSGCSICEQLKQCQAIVKSGALLPCQPQNQRPVMNAREKADFAQGYDKTQWGSGHLHRPATEMIGH